MARAVITFILVIFISLTSCITNNEKNTMNTKTDGKVTGLGGIFFKVKDPHNTRDWYKKNLGFVTNDYGSLFHTKNKDNASEYSQWSPFAATTDYFEPSKKDFMINLRVNNLELLLNRFKENGVVVLDSIETYEYGKFLHIIDNEQNKIELWEPVDNVFTRLYSGQTTDNIWITGFTFVAENPDALKTWYNHNLGISFTNDKSELPFNSALNEVRSFNFNLEPVSADHELFTKLNKTFFITYTAPESFKPDSSLSLVHKEYYQDIDSNLFKLIYN